MSTAAAAAVESQDSSTADARSSAVSLTAPAEPLDVTVTAAPVSRDGDALVAACEIGDLDAVSSLLDAGVHADTSNA